MIGFVRSTLCFFLAFFSSLDLSALKPSSEIVQSIHDGLSAEMSRVEEETRKQKVQRLKLVISNLRF